MAARFGVDCLLLHLSAPRGRVPLLHTLLEVPGHLPGSELGKVCAAFPWNLDRALGALSSGEISLGAALLFLGSECLLLPL